MRITKDWIVELAHSYGKRSKEIRDYLWPDAPARSLAYFDSYQNIGVKVAEQIADAIGCSVDELLRRKIPYSSSINGNNNSIGNVNINNDPESLHQIINAQQRIINHQDEEIQRMKDSHKEELNRMSDQLKAKDAQIDRLIKMAQGDDNQ